MDKIFSPRTVHRTKQWTETRWSANIWWCTVYWTYTKTDRLVCCIELCIALWIVVTRWMCTIVDGWIFCPWYCQQCQCEISLLCSCAFKINCNGRYQIIRICGGAKLGPNMEISGQVMAPVYKGNWLSISLAAPFFNCRPHWM